MLKIFLQSHHILSSSNIFLNQLYCSVDWIFNEFNNFLTSSPSFPLILLQRAVAMAQRTWPAAEAAEVPGFVYHPDEGVPRFQARGTHLSGWVTAKVTCSWQEGCEDGLLSPDHFRAHVSWGAVGRVCGILTMARKQLLWEDCSRCYSWKQPRAFLLGSQWFYKHLPPCLKFLSIYNQVTSDNHN